MLDVSDRLSRILLLIPYVMKKDGIKVDELCEIFNVDKETIKEDLDLICYCGLPEYTYDQLIECTIDRGKVSLNMRNYFSRPVRFSVREANSILHALSLVKKIPTIVSKNILDSIEDKIISVLPPPQAGDERQEISYFEIEEMDKNIADILVESCRDSESVEIEYLSQDNIKSSRIIKPYNIICYGSSWYLVAFCELRNEFRLFKVDRILSIKKKNTKFEKDAKFLLSDYLDTIFYPTEDSYKVRIKFAPALLSEIKEIIGDSHIEMLDDGNSVATINTTSFSWLISKLLVWGKSVQVLEPPELVDKLLTHLYRN